MTIINIAKILKIKYINKKLTKDNKCYEKWYNKLDDLVEKCGINLNKRLNDDNYTINSVKLLQSRPFYDTEWQINCNDAKIKIVRYDGETYYELIEALNKCDSLKDIENLDQRHLIYYD